MQYGNLGCTASGSHAHVRGCQIRLSDIHSIVIEWRLTPLRIPRFHVMPFVVINVITRRMDNVLHVPAPLHAASFFPPPGADELCRGLFLRVPPLDWRSTQTESGRLIFHRREHVLRRCLHRRGGLLIDLANVEMLLGKYRLRDAVAI